MIQAYNIINGIDDLQWSDFLEKVNTNRTRYSHQKLFVKYCRTNKIKYSFSIRAVPKRWNQLSDNKIGRNTELLDIDPNFCNYKYDYDE